MSKWISIEDRLPEKLQKVLFYCIRDEFIKNIYMGYLCGETWNIYLPYESVMLKKDINQITHWMELPDYPSN